VATYRNQKHFYAAGIENKLLSKELQSLIW